MKKIVLLFVSAPAIAQMGDFKKGREYPLAPLPKIATTGAAAKLNQCGEYFSLVRRDSISQGKPPVVYFEFYERDDFDSHPTGRSRTLITRQDQLAITIDEKKKIPTVAYEGSSSSWKIRISKKDYEIARPCLPELSGSAVRM